MDLLEIATTSSGIAHLIPEAVDTVILDAEIEHYLNEVEREGTATTTLLWTFITTDDYHF